ncbi:MAG TPA: hypothetical protein VFD32_20905, partial [Dehalococcoidia bacterium]|nr:hypothetical protein [Dehalococcoidia bacterium]
GESLAARTFAVVGPVQLSGIAGWASGDGSLLACAPVSSAPPFPMLHLSVARQDGTGETLLGPARQMTDAALPCLTLPPHGQLKPGVYRASVVDAEGREVGRATADLIGGLELRDAGGWAAGDAALGVCFGKGSDLATASLAARVVRRDGTGEGWLSQPASADDAGPAGMVCLNVDPAEPIEAGAYDVAIVDGLGRVVRETTVTLPAP